MSGNDEVDTGAEEARQKIFGIQRNVFFLGLTSLFNDISSEMIYPIIPIFLTTVLGAPATIVGLVEGIATSTASLIQIASGWFSDRYKNRKNLTLIGYSLSTLSKPLLALSFFWWEVLIVRFADRTGKGIRTPPRDALIADSAEPAEYGKNFGFHRALDTVGAAIGPLIAFALLPILPHSGSEPNYRLFFALSIIPGILSVLMLALFVTERRKSKVFKMEKIRLSHFPREFIIFLGIVLLFTIGNSSDAFLILRAKNIGIAVTLIPIVYLLFNLVNAGFATYAGILSDRIGRKFAMIVGFLAFALVYYGFGVAGSQLAIWLLFAFYGIYYAFTEGIFKAYTADIVEEKVRGTAFGLLNMVLGIALLPASLIAGFLWDKVSVSAPFYYGAITATVSLLLALILLPNKKFT